MSSPITFSGFNNIDFGTVLTSLMQQASVPLTNLQNKQSALTSQVTTYGTLETNVQTLESAASALDQPSSLSTFAATSTDSTAVSVSGAGAANAGHYDLVVNNLARAQVTVSSSVTADSNSTVVASGGSLTIGSATVNVAGNQTLQQLADSINATANVGVNASVVQTGAQTFRLALTSTVTGQAAAFTVTNNLTGGTGVAFADTNGNGVSGDSTADNAVNASDASITLNNIGITSGSNTFNSVIPGVSFTVFKKDPATTVGIDVAPDSTALVSKVQAFVDAYNSLASFVSAQRTSAANGNTSSIGMDPLLAQLQNSIKTQLLGAHGSASVTRLTAIGIEFTQTGTLQFNQDTFAAAVNTNATDVGQLLAGTNGAFTAIDSVLQDYGQAAGFISTVQDRLNQEITSMNSQISDMQNRLAVQRTALQAQFTAADEAISRLQSQSGQLQSLSANLIPSIG